MLLNLWKYSSAKVPLDKKYRVRIVPGSDLFIYVYVQTALEKLRKIKMTSLNCLAVEPN